MSSNALHKLSDWATRYDHNEIFASDDQLSGYNDQSGEGIYQNKYNSQVSSENAHNLSVNTNAISQYDNIQNLR